MLTNSMEAGMETNKVVANFWRCNQIKKIRVGYWRDNGVFHEAASVPVCGSDYTIQEDAEAKRLCATLAKGITYLTPSRHD